MRLQTQPPLGVHAAILEHKFCVGSKIGTIHRLKREYRKQKAGQAFRRKSRLWVHQLELITFLNNEIRTLFGADAKPVDPQGRNYRAVRFDRDFKPAPVEFRDHGLVEL